MVISSGFHGNFMEESTIIGESTINDHFQYVNLQAGHI